MPAMIVVEWLLESDPSIRWQVMRDLTDAPADEVATERACGARRMGRPDPRRPGRRGRWSGGALFPEWRRP